MTPTPLDEALEGEIKGCGQPLGTHYGLRIAHGLRLAAGLGARPDCRIADYSRTWEHVCIRPGGWMRGWRGGI
eukprot:589684-Alexandrium_andersonii.AAC.1